MTSFINTSNYLIGIIKFPLMARVIPYFVRARSKCEGRYGCTDGKRRTQGH